MIIIILVTTKYEKLGIQCCPQKKELSFLNNNHTVKALMCLRVQLETGLQSRVTVNKLTVIAACGSRVPLLFFRPLSLWHEAALSLVGRLLSRYLLLTSRCPSLNTPSLIYLSAIGSRSTADVVTSASGYYWARLWRVKTSRGSEKDTCFLTVGKVTVLFGDGGPYVLRTTYGKIILFDSPQQH